MKYDSKMQQNPSIAVSSPNTPRCRLADSLDDSDASRRSEAAAVAPGGSQQRIVHTVSAYRRLQKRVDGEVLTPVRTVVRPPSSPNEKSANNNSNNAMLRPDDASAVFLRAKEYDDRMKV